MYSTTLLNTVKYRWLCMVQGACVVSMTQHTVIYTVYEFIILLISFARRYTVQYFIPGLQKKVCTTGTVYKI